MRHRLARVGLGLAVAAGLQVVSISTAQASGGHVRDERLRADVTIETPDYDFELILADDTVLFGENVGAFVRRTDDVGSFGTDPDPHGTVQASAWDAMGGRNCVTVNGGLFSFPGAADHAFDYGLAGRNVRRVDVVMDDGTRVATHTTRIRVDGWRGWMVERAPGTAVRVEGFDRRGRLVAAATITLPDVSDHAQSEETCERFPFPTAEAKR